MSNQTGNIIVDQVAQINFTGNVIPQTWYQTIVRDSGKPNLNAIIILADIVYWYRPAEVRDETTGMIVKQKKRFKEDLLQRSYQQIADQFGISKREASNAIIELEKLGVVRRVFRTIIINGIAVNNVLYLELDAKQLRKITYPTDLSTQSPDKESPIPFQSDSPLHDIVPSHFEKGQALTLKSDTNTENTTENINISNPILSYPILSYQAAKDYLSTSLGSVGWDAIRCAIEKDKPHQINLLDTMEQILIDTYMSQKKTLRLSKIPIPVEQVWSAYDQLDELIIRQVLDQIPDEGVKSLKPYLQTALYNAVLTRGQVCPAASQFNMPDSMEQREDVWDQLCDNVGYQALCQQYPKDQVEEILELMVDTICSTKDAIRISGTKCPIEVVRSRFLKIKQPEMEYILFCLQKNTTKITNIRQYLLAVIYNAPTTINQYYQTLVGYNENKNV